MVDPLAAFYAAVTAVEAGKVGEIELEYRSENGDESTVMTMTVRRDVRQLCSMIHMPDEDDAA